MKGRGKSARMAAVAAPRGSSSGGAGPDAAAEGGSATTISASAVDPAREDGEGEGVTAAAVADAVPADSAAEQDQEPDFAPAFAQATVARAEDLDMDETEYTDEVDNEFVRGRMENVVRVATAKDIKVAFGDGCHTDLSGEVQVDPNDPSKDSSAEDRIVMMQGGLEHEITHELYYDKSAFEDMKSQIEADPSKRPLAFISNILVDGHDEWRHKLARPEAYGIIEAHDELMVRHNGSGRWSFDPDNQDTWTQVTGAMLYRGLPYYRVPEDKLSDEAREVYRDLSPHVDAAIKGTSHDCIRQSNEIFEKLKSRGLIPENPNQDHLGGGAGPGAEGSPGMGGSSSGSQSQSGSGGGSSAQGVEDGELGGEGADAYDASVSDSGGQGEQGGSQGEGSQSGGSGGQGEPEAGEQSGGSPGGGSDGAGSGSDGPGSEGGSGGGQAGSQSASQGAGEGSTGTGGDSSGEDGGSGNGDGNSDSSKAGSPGGSGSGKADSKGSDFVANPGASEEELENRRGQAKSLANTAASKKPQSSHRANFEEQVQRPADALSEFRGRWQKNRRLAHEFATQIKQAQTETTAPKRKQTSGRLDRGRRRALAAGDEKVFVKRGREREVDMSVELLLDVSGSMKGSVDGLKDSSSVISRGLDEAKIEHEVRGFSSEDTMPLYRSFGEKADWKLGSMQASGSTDMGGGISKLREGFSGRTEKQKLGLILADGRPNEEQSVRDQLAAARREGVTPFGIFLRAEPDPADAPVWMKTSQQRRKWAEDQKRQASAGEEKMRELFGGNVAVLDDVGQLPKVAGKKIVELMRRQS